MAAGKNYVQDSVVHFSVPKLGHGKAASCFICGHTDEAHKAIYIAVEFSVTAALQGLPKKF